MTFAESIAAWLLVPVLLACLWRARLLALAILPPLALSAAQWLELVDTSSAYHPLRWLVPIASLSVAMFAAWRSAIRIHGISRMVQWLDNLPYEWQGVLAEMDARRRARGGGPGPKNRDNIARHRRALVASVLIFASGCADIPALLAWGLPGEWVLVPLQIAVCLVVIGALVAPERWFYVR